MELMSSLLLYALVALAPQALGKSLGKIDIGRKFNNTMYVREKSIGNKKTLSNINGPRSVNVVNELQRVFSDVICRSCIDCMERAVKAHKLNLYIIDNQRSSDNFQNSVLYDLYKINNNRMKRDMRYNTTPAYGKEIKTNCKKNKIHKTVTIMKYHKNGGVYALKVKEMNNLNTIGRDNLTKVSSTDCQVYSVKKSFACNSLEAETILAFSKRTVGNEKKNVKKENLLRIVKNATGTTSKITAYRKRQVDNSQVPENVMPSIEELMY